MPAPETVLHLNQISKRFGALLANDHISLELRQGEILALLGENGAGKTTLMNILFGHYSADAGTIEVFGQPLKITSPKAAIAAGIGMVHQHFTLADNLSVLDNIMLGTESLWRPWQNRRVAKQRLMELSEQFGLEVNPDAKIAQLSVGERQRVEILKALYRDVKILILDEPTAVLTPQETEALFTTLRKLTRSGLSIVFISHKLQEVLNISHRIVVLRAGQRVAEVETVMATAEQLAELMVGRPLPQTLRQPLAPGEPILELFDVTVQSPNQLSGHAASRQSGWQLNDPVPNSTRSHRSSRPRRLLLDQINLTVCQHEIVGIAGVSGNGQGALFDLISGLVAPSQGEMRLYGQSATQLSPAAAVQAGVARIPEDRHTGVIGDLSLWENLILEHHAELGFSQGGWLKLKAANQHAAELIQAFDVRCPSAKVPARLLSGGNMQKLILGRVLSRRPKLILASQPTRGLDLGAVTEVHRLLLQARTDGAGILLISEDLEELLMLSDRLYVISRGRLSFSLLSEQVNVREIGLMMAGK